MNLQNICKYFLKNLDFILLWIQRKYKNYNWVTNPERYLIGTN